MEIIIKKVSMLVDIYSYCLYLLGNKKAVQSDSPKPLRSC